MNELYYKITDILKSHNYIDSASIYDIQKLVLILLSNTIKIDGNYRFELIKNIFTLNLNIMFNNNWEYS